MKLNKNFTFERISNFHIPVRKDGSSNFVSIHPTTTLKKEGENSQEVDWRPAVYEPISIPQLENGIAWASLFDDVLQRVP